MSTLYWVVYPSVQTAPAASEIIAGTVSNGIFGNSPSPVVSTDPVILPISGLLSGTSYKAAVVWDDGTDTSDVVVSDEFSTLAPITGTVINAWTGSLWTPGLLKRWDGLEWVPGVAQRWTGGVWVEE